MPTSDVNVAAMLDTLDRHDVEYLVIGGFAVELHDVAIPPTRDVDITPAPADANLRRLAAALAELGARFRVPDGPGDGVEIPGGITAEWIAGMVTLTLVTDAGPLDVSLVPDGTAGFEDLVPGSVEISFDGRSVRVAALEDIIRSKEAAGRVKDIVVLPALRAHLRRRSNG